MQIDANFGQGWEIETLPFLAVQDSSITDIVRLSELTNNESLGSIKELS